MKTYNEVHFGGGMSSGGSALRYSALDSQRFGFRVFRTREFACDSAQLVRDIIEADCDVAIVRLPAGGSIKFVQELAELGFPAVHADTLVYYECSLTNLLVSLDPVEGVTVESAVLEDSKELSTLVELVFQNYSSHYAANELFEPTLVAEGYAEWAMSFTNAPDRNVLLARAGDQIVGFLTLEVREQNVEIVLNGIHPEWTGRGIYGSLVRAAQRYGSEQDAERLIVSTQANNITVQRAWHREGLSLYAAYDTFHVNALLQSGNPYCDIRFNAREHLSVRYLSQELQEFLRLEFDVGLRLSNLEIVVLDTLVEGDLRLTLRSVPQAGSQRELLVGRLQNTDNSTVGIVRAERRLLKPSEINSK
jgi:GNAT superfamily N-acetyltransferase